MMNMPIWDIGAWMSGLKSSRGEKEFPVND